MSAEKALTHLSKKAWQTLALLAGMVDCVAHPEDPICRQLYPPTM